MCVGTYVPTYVGTCVRVYVGGVGVHTVCVCLCVVGVYVRVLLCFVAFLSEGRRYGVRLMFEEDPFGCVTEPPPGVVAAHVTVRIARRTPEHVTRLLYIRRKNILKHCVAVIRLPCKYLAMGYMKDGGSPNLRLSVSSRLMI